MKKVRIIVYLLTLSLTLSPLSKSYVSASTTSEPLSSNPIEEEKQNANTEFTFNSEGINYDVKSMKMKDLSPRLYIVSKEFKHLLRIIIIIIMIYQSLVIISVKRNYQQLRDHLKILLLI
jgi:hypothetical protein